VIIRRTRATIHGAISIVNALATFRGSALGISLQVVAEAELRAGVGKSGPSYNYGKLVRNIIYNTIPKQVLEKHSVHIKVESEIPIGFGLKSSSAVSNAVALACSTLVKEKADDRAVLDVATRASLDAGVTITGAYDDSSACYYGGFVITDNRANELILHEKAPGDLFAVIFIPNRQRGNLTKLSTMSEQFEEAFKLASSGDYWKAMNLNGKLLATALCTEYEPMMDAIHAGALGASISGNGPAIAAVSYERKIAEIRNAFSKFDGSIIVSKVNNEKAKVDIIIG
jgi:shikimate kinase